MPSTRAVLAIGSSAAALALAAAGVACPQALARPAKAPTIKARPSNAMVNTQIKLKGHGFKPDSTIQLRECGRTFWIVPEDPCNTGNALSVQTDAKGRFKTQMNAEVCPEGEAGGVITERTCYIGEPQAAGEDTETLVGAVKIIVTYP